MPTFARGDEVTVVRPHWAKELQSIRCTVYSRLGDGYIVIPQTGWQHSRFVMAKDVLEADPHPCSMPCHRCIREFDLRAYGQPLSSTRMIGCDQCGNKRCPHASDHRLECTGSNEPGQVGSVYGG